MSKYEVISGPYFLVFGLNSGKYGPEIASYLGTFHEVSYIILAIFKIRIFTQTNSKIWYRNYFLQGTWNMEPDCKIFRALEPLNKFKKEIKKWSVMHVHVECAKCTFNVLALLTRNRNVFSLGHQYSNTTCFSIFINRNFSPRIHTADIISL